MSPVFHQTSEEYRTESAQISPLWRVWAPIVAPIALGAIAAIDPDRYYAYFEGEQGVLEFLHALLPLLAAAIAMRLLFTASIRRDALVAAWLAFFVIGGLYLGGEEASWGQHYFGWSTPEGWAEINRQEETNLHNTSFWLDRFPRIVMTVGIIVGGLILPYIKLRRPDLIPPRLDFIVPPLALSTLTAVMIAGEILSGLRETTGAIGSILHFRPGEMQENFITAFIFFYVVALGQRARRVRPTVPATGRAALGGGRLAPGE